MEILKSIILVPSTFYYITFTLIFYNTLEEKESDVCNYLQTSFFLLLFLIIDDNVLYSKFGL